MSALVLPDTALARAAVEQARAALTPALWNHSLRTFCLARAYGNARQIAHDEEELFIASVFHDVGLCEQSRKKGQRFTATSNEALRAFGAGTPLGSEPERLDRMQQAIALHMCPLPAWSKGGVVPLLQIGAWMDLTFLRRWSVRADAREISRQWPRAGIDLEFARRLLRSVVDRFR